MQKIKEQKEYWGMFRNLLGGNSGQTQTGLEYFLRELTTAINGFVAPVFGIIGVAGIFFALYLAWRLASAEDDNKRKEAKKQLLWTVIAIIALFGFIILFQILGVALAEQTFQ